MCHSNELAICDTIYREYWHAKYNNISNRSYGECYWNLYGEFCSIAYWRGKQYDTEYVKLYGFRLNHYYRESFHEF